MQPGSITAAADGVYLQARMEEHAECMLVMIRVLYSTKITMTGADGRGA